MKMSSKVKEIRSAETVIVNSEGADESISADAVFVRDANDDQVADIVSDDPVRAALIIAAVNSFDAAEKLAVEGAMLLHFFDTLEGDDATDDKLIAAPLRRALTAYEEARDA